MNTKSELMNAIAKYQKKFGLSFPYFNVMSMGDDEIVKLIDECIAKDKPYKSSIPKDAIV